MLHARGLCKSYAGRRVVQSIDVAVQAGQVLGLLGPNGAGKTTTFRMLCGVESPDSGTVHLVGNDITALPLATRARLGLGYLPQEDTLFHDADALGNVAIATSLSRSGLSAAALLDTVGLGNFGARKPGTLSGGERKRLAIARLLGIAPKVLLLDEPFAGVDPIAVADLQGLVRRLANTGVGVLITDHAVRETLGVCDMVIVIDGGEVHARGTPTEVAQNPHVRARYLGAQFVL